MACSVSHPCPSGQCCAGDGSCDPCPVITAFTATPGTIDRGADPPETADLSWVTSNATTCTLDDGTGPQSVACNLLEVAVRPATTTTYTLTARNATGAQVTAQATVTVQYCHAISGLSGTCPSGATQSCRSVPIVATNSDDAQAACETCKGDRCSHTSGGGIGSGWVAFDGSNGGIFIYESGTIARCGSYITQAGDITNFQFCFLNRWAP